MELLTPQQAADLLQVHITTIYRWIDTGELKGTKFGDSWRIDQANIETKLKGNGSQNQA